MIGICWRSEPSDLKPFQRTFDQLFSFGIDPVGGGLPTDTPADWPGREEIAGYVQKIREKLDHAIEEALSKPQEGHPQLKTMLEVAIEHRLMHAETLAYMLHRLPVEKKIGDRLNRKSAKTRVKADQIEIPAGRATLGLARKNGDEFGWDNEMEAHDVEVPAFSIDKCNVTNRDFLRFIQAGGYKNRALWDDASWEWKNSENIQHPAFWRRDGQFMDVSRNVRRSALAAGLAGVSEPCGSHGVRQVAGKKIADRSAISSRRVRKSENDWHRAILSVG